jgi:aminoglycoside phosphotransferase (APT) family kinase protein
MLNYRIVTSLGPGLLRRPQSQFAGHDPRMLSEAQALRFALSAGCRVPEVLYADDNFLIERYVEGDPVSADGWQRWMDDLLRQVANLQTRPAPPVAGISTIGHWQTWLREQLIESYERYARLHPQRLATLGIPPIGAWWAAPSRPQQPPVFLHGDLHSGNLLIAGSDVWILDWELALVGDPIWEAAVAVHRTRWPSEAAEMQATQRWLATVVKADGVDDPEGVFEFYRDIELWRSLINDSDRYPALIASRPTESETIARVRSFHAKLARGNLRFGCTSASESQVREILLEWAAGTKNGWEPPCPDLSSGRRP